VYAYLKDKRILPLALGVYRINDPAVGSENLQIQRVVTAVPRDLAGRGVWVADAGLDRLEAQEMWFSRPAHFVVRQRGDRTIVTHEAPPQSLMKRVLASRCPPSPFRPLSNAFAPFFAQTEHVFIAFERFLTVF